MAQDMWGDALLAYGRLFTRSRHDVLGEDVFESGTGHGAAGGVEKEFGVAIVVADGKPFLDRCRRFLPQRKHTLASPFSHDVNGGNGLLIKLVHSKRDQLGDAQARSKGQVQHCPVTYTRDCMRVRSIEKRQQFVPGQIADQSLVGLLHGNRVDLARLVQARYQPVFQEAEEGVDGGQPGIAGPS
jgi:hypothetical protein